MNVSLEIAKRYLVGKKSTNAINLITGISVLGIAIGTMALILILSVFNGFESLIIRFLDDFNPDIKVLPSQGKRFELSEEKILELNQIRGIQNISKTIEEVALFDYNGTQEVGIIKGVDQNYSLVTQIDSTIRQGSFVLDDDDLQYAVVGSGLARRLSVNIDNPFEKLTLYSPRREKRNPFEKDFKTINLIPSGVFSIQNENDQQYIIASLEVVRNLLNSGQSISALEIKINNEVDPGLARKKISTILGSDFLVQDRYDQDDTYLKIMNIEKWMSFLIVSLTILIVAFNMIGCLWMIVLEKKKDISVLKSMGVSSGKVRNIFLQEGILISFAGIFIGFLLSVGLYLIQKRYGLISMSDGFIVDAYPIELKWLDFVIVIILVITIGVLASLMPALKASKIPAYIREE